MELLYLQIVLLDRCPRLNMLFLVYNFEGIVIRVQDELVYSLLA